MRATIAIAGMMSFQQTAIVFVSASQRTPSTLIVQKSNITTAATP